MLARGGGSGEHLYGRLTIGGRSTNRPELGGGESSDPIIASKCVAVESDIGCQFRFDEGGMWHIRYAFYAYLIKAGVKNGPRPFVYELPGYPQVGNACCDGAESIPQFLAT